MGLGPRSVGTASTGGVAGDNAFAVILECPGSMGSVLNVEVANLNAAGDAALTDFKVQLKDHPDGEWYDYVSGSDFGSGSVSAVLFCSTVVPNTLAKNAKSHFHLKINAAARVQFLAKCGAGTTSHVVIKASGRDS